MPRVVAPRVGPRPARSDDAVHRRRAVLHAAIVRRGGRGGARGAHERLQIRGVARERRAGRRARRRRVAPGAQPARVAYSVKEFVWDFDQKINIFAKLKDRFFSVKT